MGFLEKNDLCLVGLDSVFECVEFFLVVVRPDSINVKRDGFYWERNSS